MRGWTSCKESSDYLVSHVWIILGWGSMIEVNDEDRQ
jgi:hypothetical protein